MTQRVAIMKKYYGEAQTLSKGLGLFGSRKRKKHEAAINTQIANDIADFNRERTKIRGRISNKQREYLALQKRLLAMRAENKQIKHYQTSITNLIS